MEILKKINKTVKNKQILRAIGGTGFIVIGLSLLFDYYEHDGFSRCQKFIHDCYPEEYASITEKVIKEVSKT